MTYEDLLRMLRGPYPTLMMDGCTKISPHLLAEAHDAIATLQAELAAARVEIAECDADDCWKWKARAQSAEARAERLKLAAENAVEAMENAAHDMETVSITAGYSHAIRTRYVAPLRAARAGLMEAMEASGTTSEPQG